MTQDAMSGCDQRVLNWLPIFESKAKAVTIITSEQGLGRFGEFSQVKVLKTTGYRLKSSLGLFISYLVRAIKGCSVSRRIKVDNKAKNIIYSASDLIPDFIPALSLKLRNKTSSLVVGLHLIAPLPWKGFKKYYLKGFSLPTFSGIYYFLSQSIILLIAKRYASLVLVSNHQDRETLIKQGFKSEKVLVTYGGINTNQIDEVESSEIAYDACYVGRFHAQKGFEDLIDIWLKVNEKFPSAKLAVAGYDINLEKIKTLVRENGLENNILFKGFLGGGDKYKLIKSSKIALVPSYYESFGMVILEALACGVCVIAYDLPVYRDIYTKGVKTVGIANKDAFAEAIIDLLKDSQQRQSLSKQAKDLSRDFSWVRSAKDILAHLTT